MIRDREPKDVVTVIRLEPLRRADGTSDESAQEKRGAVDSMWIGCYGFWPDINTPGGDSAPHKDAP